MNNCLFFGTLTRDPVLKYVGAKKTPLCELGIAVESSYGENKETAFIDCNVWAKQGEACANNLAKGHKVALQGRMTYQSWEDKETHKKRSKLILTVERIMLGRLAEGSSTPRRQANQQADDRPPEEDEALNNL